MNFFVRSERRIREVGLVAGGTFVFSFSILRLFMRGRMQLHPLLRREGFATLVADESMMVDHHVITGTT